MKRWILYLTWLCLAFACTFDLRTPEDPDDGAAKGFVTVSFSVPDVQLAPPTKSLEDGQGSITDPPYLDPEKLFLVVCGGSQSIKYVRKAKYIGTEQKAVSEIPDYPLTVEEGDDSKVTLYKFQVQLEISDTERTIHFLGNIDENQLITGAYSYSVLPFLMSFEGKQAFWQKVIMPSIKPRTVEGTNGVLDFDTNTGSYFPDEATAARLRYVPLIRNYAEIRLTNKADKFQLHSYALIFYPKRGAVVPYRHNLRFNPDKPDQGFTFTDNTSYRFSGYETCGIEDLEDADKFDYPGNLPSGVEFTSEEDIPDASMFVDPSTSNGRVILYDEDVEQGFYIYEREIPTATLNPTFIILCGRFTTEENDNQLYFYRLDLMETKNVNGKSVAQYYPIYRNFVYDITLSRVTSVGVETPMLAAYSSGAEDISADVSMRHLADISNGISRLVVEPYMARTFTGPNPEEGEYYEIYARFFNNADSDSPNTDATAVQVTLEPMTDGDDDILVMINDNNTPVRSFFPRTQTIDGVPGFRVIRFNLKEASDRSRTQKIRITGWNTDPNVHELYPLYREVEITLQEKQEMKVECAHPQLSRAKGSEQPISISIPTGLPESMFPLVFTIEAERMTLTPVPGDDPGNNLPVKQGKSIGNPDKTTFQFLRTLTWNEYNSLPASGGQCTFMCYFKSNRSESATTIWVYNEFFERGIDAFENADEITNHFYVLAKEDCIVRIDNLGKLEYRLNDEAWQTYTANTSLHISKDNKVSFRAVAGTEITGWNGGRFYCYKPTSSYNKKDAQFEVGGNIASLIIGDEYEDRGAGLTNSFSFTDFFKGHINLTDASELVLPMLTCQSSCYKSMFDGRSSLVSGPRELPATRTAYQSYRNMFLNCSSLVNAPVIADAVQAGRQSYQRMFEGCSQLSYIKFLGTTYTEAAYFTDWVKGVAAEGVFVVKEGAAIATKSRGNNTIPALWDVQTVSE